ncbi:hypothetical protein DY000_02039143 [Brassica cretica]|uniref:Uncharacterized protein n=1 Tax=Brassica cretica TaxID=69181 RepID=A0ABQ7BD77_BRACR|nr:hypothetical protein DY000_02039143 [Brassica cretica]
MPLDFNHNSAAKILFEVELSKGFPSRIAANDENGFISMVDVDYACTVVVETNKLPKSAQPDISLVQTSAVTVSPQSNESSVVDIAILENQLCDTLSAIPVFLSVTEMILLMTFLRWKGPRKLLELKSEAAKYWKHKDSNAMGDSIPGMLRLSLQENTGIPKTNIAGMSSE